MRDGSTVVQSGWVAPNRFFICSKKTPLRWLVQVVKKIFLQHHTEETINCIDKSK